MRLEIDARIPERIRKLLREKLEIDAEDVYESVGPLGLSALMAIGVIDEPLNMLFTEFAVVLGLVYVLVPFMILPIYASVERLDWSLVQASQDLGAGAFQTFRRVILPLTMPGIAAGSLITFIPALGNFIVPAFLGGSKVQMTGNVIERQFLQARNWPFGSALAMVIMASVLIVLLIVILRASPARTGDGHA